VKACPGGKNGGVIASGIAQQRRRRRADDKTTNIGESEWQGAGKEENAGVKLGNRGPVVAIIIKGKT
jgi:hypothetical protein